MRFFKIQLGLFLALLVSNAIVLYSDLSWVWLRFPAALALVFILPGWSWLPALGWMKTNRGVERIILVIGFSSLLSALALFIAVLLPIPFVEKVVIAALFMTILAGLIIQSISPLQQSSKEVKIEWPSRSVLLILLAIIAVAAFTRLTRLGYAEFHEDALENMRLIVRAYKGEEYAPFLDSKGPIHWLLPAALWYLNGWLNEGIARTPFAITSLLLIPMLYVLGRRVSDGRDSIGLLAAGFVAVNGFFVAYARHVENPSLIVFWGALAMWFAYRYYREDINHFLIYIALTLAIGLITHPDVLLYLPVFAYIIWVKFWNCNRRPWFWLAGAGLIFVGLLAIFYIPYLIDPNISSVRQYFGNDRIGQALFYNRVGNMFDQDMLYSTRYHAPLLVLLLVWSLGRSFASWRGWPVTVLLGLAMVSVVIWPEMWIINGLNMAFVPYILLVLIFTLLPSGATFEIKVIFLWFSLPLCALMFLAKDAADHIQIAYTGWAILSAFALADLWHISYKNRFYSQILKSAIVLVLVIISSLIIYYQYLTFDSPVTTYWQAKIESANNPNSIYNRLYGSISRPRKLFSNPRLGGWKVVGYLQATGVISGDFRTINESFTAPIWYSFQTARSCYEDPQNYWIRRGWNGWPEKDEQKVIKQGYALTRIVLVDGKPKLHLYEKNTLAREPEILDMEDYRRRFDYLATPSRFAKNGSSEPKGQLTALDFGGGKIRLLGYELPSYNITTGDRLPITVYWEALTYMDVRYRGFMHLVDDNNNLLAQHDDDPACRLLTTDMRPGQQSSRQFRLSVSPDTPPGEYKIIFGLYHPGSLERLEIWDSLNQRPVGNSVILGRVTIE